jgi:hypothetical protein
MNKSEIIVTMVDLLQQTLDGHRLDHSEDAVRATADLPLIGEEAAVSSMALVSFIADVESTLMERFGLTVTLVSERALSRKKSPFRTADALADYVLELAQASSEVGS